MFFLRLFMKSTLTEMARVRFEDCSNPTLDEVIRRNQAGGLGSPIALYVDESGNGKPEFVKASGFDASGEYFIKCDQCDDYSALESSFLSRANGTYCDRNCRTLYTED